MRATDDTSPCFVFRVTLRLKVTASTRRKKMNDGPLSCRLCHHAHSLWFGHLPGWWWVFITPLTLLSDESHSRYIRISFWNRRIKTNNKGYDLYLNKHTLFSSQQQEQPNKYIKTTELAHLICAIKLHALDYLRQDSCNGKIYALSADISV